MKTLETSIEISASSQKVWEILVDWKSYPQWNSFMEILEGALKEGSQIRVCLRQPGMGKFIFSPILLKAAYPELRWKGKVWREGIFDGEHYFRVESLSAQKCRFIHGEIFSGFLVPLMGRLLKKTRDGFEKMNEALKQRAQA